jgi:hypothetical protein
MATWRPLRLWSVSRRIAADLEEFSSRAFSLVVPQVVFMLLLYSLP